MSYGALKIKLTNMQTCLQHENMLVVAQNHQGSKHVYLLVVSIGGGKEGGGGGGGGGGGARGLKPPLRMISHRNYLSWSGAENRDKDRDTLIEQSL